MSRFFNALLFCVFFAGCGSAENLSAREADQTFDTITQVASDIIGVTRDAVEHGGRGLKVDSDGPNFSITGDLSEGTDWDGNIDISGTASQKRNNYDYELVVALDQVSDEDTTVDGEVSLVFFADDVDIDFVFAVGVSIDGDLDVTGKAEGNADIEYDLEFSMNGFDVDLSASGTISGHDVSGFPEDLTITL